jgi:enoyl-CoA hydratase/carnithine racemase
VGLPLPSVIFSELRRLVGPRLAERLAVTGLLVSPREAATLGLVDEVVPEEQVVDRAVRWCENLVALPQAAMNLTRRRARADLVGEFTRDLDHELVEVAPGGGIRGHKPLFTAWWNSWP